ncbi:nuclear protein DGCR14 [Naematelia encephala]|uniref:Nuclear protein DGCR14 n=1 Tax=Naematelia encephala TaxID=71784 RepID=A0A1Y2B909_9TREE|nr:nuclear protein DGCR14 [Naematelia encephala]
MSGEQNLIPRNTLASAPRLIEGPKIGQRSLYHQQVLDEDTYTGALSHIITRDFFPNLPHIHATNDYLTALTNNDGELLSASIRRLAQLAQEKENGRQGSRNPGETEATNARRRELENMGTPYITVPGCRQPLRTPVGARGWDTPLMGPGEGSTRRRVNDDLDDLDSYADSLPGKKRKIFETRQVRDDLSLDTFQANYTSEDNASFVQIVDEENRRRKEERWSWAWEAEKKAELRRLEGEEKRKMILDAATNGTWRIDGNGRRLVGSLMEGGADRPEGEAWKEPQRLIAADAEPLEADSSQSSTAVITATDAAASQATALAERPIPSDHPLNRALASAGLPTTALISLGDRAIVPHREVTSGAGEGRGRGENDRVIRDLTERSVMGNEEKEVVSLGGSGADQWGYKTMNNLMFPADANTKSYPDHRKSVSVATRQAAREIKHSNTRLPDEDESEPLYSKESRRGSSPARSWVDAAVKGTPYRPGGNALPSVNDYALLPNDPSPSPQELPSLLTWGTLLATPRAIEGVDDPLDTNASSFRLPATQRRDELGRKLADKASRSMNERAKSFAPLSSTRSALGLAAKKTQQSLRGNTTPGKMLPPSSTPRRQADALTPAAKRLLERSMGRTPQHGTNKPGSTGSRNRGAAMERGSAWSSGSKGGLNRRSLESMSWTPSPRHRH